MGLFNNINPGKSLFVNEIALDYDFVPKMLPFRESQQQQIASAIKPLFSNRNGRNLILVGPPGVGKTVGCKHVIQELEETTDDITPLYVNCWQKNTTYKVVLELSHLLGYHFTQNKKTEEIFSVVKSMLNKQSAVLVFDEVDKAEEYDFVYSLVEELYRKTIILITNYDSFIESMDRRISSRLLPEVIKFSPYTLEETKGILKARCSYAFLPNIVSVEALEKIAAKTHEFGDIRTGLFMLREAGRAAEDENSEIIRGVHADIAMQRLSSFTSKKKAELDDETQRILEIAQANSGSKIGLLYKIYQKQGGNLVYKSFQRRIQKLSENRYITTEKSGGGSEGNTTIIKTVVEKKLTDF